MSMSHKAYEFDWLAFERELAPMLHENLVTGSIDSIVQFVDANRGSCRDLAFGEPLAPTWRDDVEPYDVQHVGDVALTKYYDPNDDFGLAESWIDLRSTLGTEESIALLGRAFGPPHALFDPGFQGSYFQAPSVVGQSLQRLANIPGLEPFSELLARAARNGSGVYVTF